MDEKFVSVVNDVMSQENINGVLLVDEYGLCIASKGTASSSSSGFFADLMNKASDLGENVPVISIETSEQKMYVTKDDGIVTVVYKKN